MTRLRKRSGFTLMELLIAASLGVIVLAGVIQIAGSMLRYQFEEMRKGKASGGNLLALQRMHKEIENASFVNVPSNPVTSSGLILVLESDGLGGCVNYLQYQTPAIPAKIASPDSSWAFWYCKTASTHGSFPDSLVRYQHPTCPIVFPGPTCGNALAGGTMEVLVFNNFFKDGTAGIFDRDAGNYLKVRYIVGRATPTVEIPIPVAYRVNTMIHMNIPYSGNNW